MTQQRAHRVGTPSVTLRDVARDAGVSATTVSRILNDRATGVPISDATRARVLAAASRLGYQPNLLARGLRGSKSSLIGVIARDISDPFHVQILKGINEVLRSRDYRLFLGHVNYEARVAIDYGSMFERTHADGIIVIGDIEGSEDALDALARQHRFIVGIADRSERRQIPGVYADSQVGTQLAMDHLWQLGHRRIICVSDSRTYDGRSRIDRYEHFMREHGVVGQIRVFVTDLEPAPSFELGQRIFSDHVGTGLATAVYTTSDTVAIGLMRAAFQAGVSVPQDVSVVGYDDIDIAPYTIPPLTTISQSGVEMGRTAAALLLELADLDLDRDHVSDIVMSPTLVVRQSTTMPASAPAPA